MLSYFYVDTHTESELAIQIDGITEAQKDFIFDVVDACCCRYLFASPTSIIVQGSRNGVITVEAEVLALVSKLTFLENCLNRS